MKKITEANQRWLDFAHYFPRRDSKAERAIDIGIELQRDQSTGRAAMFLRDHGIKFETALRVLTKHDARRALPVSPVDGNRPAIPKISELNRSQR